MWLYIFLITTEQVFISSQLLPCASQKEIIYLLGVLCQMLIQAFILILLLMKLLNIFIILTYLDNLLDVNLGKSLLITQAVT